VYNGEKMKARSYDSEGAFELLNIAKRISSGKREKEFPYSREMDEIYKEISSWPPEKLLNSGTDTLPKDFICLCLALITESVKTARKELAKKKRTWKASHRQIKLVAHLTFNPRAIERVKDSIKKNDLFAASNDVMGLIDLLQRMEILESFF
jgi:hypothetical protein